MNGKIVLIDGHSILNRAFYGVPLLSNEKGLHTNAVFGFLNILFKILEEEAPDYLTVAFDVGAPTFRHEIYQQYKGTRKPMPQELYEQVPVLKETLQAMGVQICEKPGLEADDILGTLAKQSEAEGLVVSLVSGDRDLLQIASDHIKIRIPKTKGGKTEIEDYYAKDVEEKYGVTPLQFIELKALMGDTSDNIPGVPKVGEKTAIALMTEYGSIDAIYENLETVSKKSIRESLRENRELAELSRVLATIRTDADISFTFEAARMHDLYTEAAYEMFRELGFKNLLGRFGRQTKKETTQKFHLVTELGEAETVFDACRQMEAVGVHLCSDQTTGVVALGICYSEQDVYLIRCQGFLTAGYVTEKLGSLQGETLLSGFFLKGMYPYFPKEDVERCFDIQLAAYLLNPLKSDYAIEDVANEYLELHMAGYGELFGKKSLAEAAEAEADFLSYACQSAYTVWAARPILEKKLAETGMDKLFHEIEMPLSYVLYDMEREGIRVEAQELHRYGEALTGRIQELEQSIHEQAGENFNINSPKQLGEILFEKLHIPGGKKTKTGYSTAADILEKLAPDYPMINGILEYRGLTKLKSTYADGLSVYIGTDGKIHTSFNQTITATGRISSTEPNLQNIPMRMELGRLIRKVFVPGEGHIFTDADYSQIELRILAHMSGDEQLIEAYRMDEDIHRITAAKVFHTPLSEVTALQRRNAKAVNFGIVYGISSFGLSQDLSISKKEAEGYIREYFSTYPGVKAFLDRTVEEARQNGYVTTLFGRRRPVPELSSSNFMQRSFGERVAMNSPIQGTAADVIKIAMIRVWKALRAAGCKSRLILQVHDELLIETVKEEAEQVEQILREEMVHAADLAVTLEVDLHTGDDWYEAK
jgi:DNA polymerase-1